MLCGFKFQGHERIVRESPHEKVEILARILVGKSGDPREDPCRKK
jgi:hypothetical protein